MTNTGIGAATWESVASELRDVLQGTVTLPGEATYEQSTTLWNGAVTNRPALIALCETVFDVQAAVRAIRTHNLPMSVRGGGHDWFGRALRDGGLVIDLTRMNSVEVDAEDESATVGGGAISRDLVAAARPHGLVATTGTIGSVGVVGMTLGGGYGPLTSHFGLALDNLLSAEVVLADGQVVTASETEEPDLFWALRGGGGNFGVVTAVRMKLHRVGDVLAGMVLYPGSEAAQVLRGYGELLATAPDELEVMASLLSGPDGSFMVGLGPTWSGKREHGQDAVAELNQLGTPVMTQVGPMSYAEMIDMFDAYIADGISNFIENRWVGELTPEVISVLVAGAQSKPSPQTIINLHPFHGAATRVPLEATAFGLRQPHFEVQIIATWDLNAGEDVGKAHRQWARDVSGQLAAATSLPGGYVSMLAPDAEDQIRAAYGPNAKRLLELKQHYDPAGVFTATPLPV